MSDDANDVAIDLGPDRITDRFVLRPSFGAHKMIERRTGKGVLEIMKAMQDFHLSLDDATIIIDQGIRAAGQAPPPAEKLQEKIWKVGLINLAVPIMSYLNLLMSGGKPEALAVETGEAEKDPSP